MVSKISDFVKNNYFATLFYLVFFIFIFYFGKSFSYNFKNSYAFSELFLNYQGGFVRRGLLGQIFLFSYEKFKISPLLFFSSLLFLFHVLNLIFFFKLIKNSKLPFEIKIITLFSPALLFFSIYDFNMFFVKDVFTKFVILLHAFIIIKTKGSLNSYIKYLKFLIIPLIFFTNIFIHEHGIFFISVHLLFSLYVLKFQKNFLYVVYGFLILFIFLIIFNFIGNENVYSEINSSLKIFGITIHEQLSGGLKSTFGGFYKWHFFYFKYKDFLMLMLSFLLSIWIFYFIFQYLINKNILLYDFKYKYYLFFIPTLGIFITALDHGRNLSLLSFHLVAFYLILKVDTFKLKKFVKAMRNNFVLLNFIYIFIFFYIFMWVLDHDAAFGGREQLNTIFKSSLFGEFVSFIKFVYVLINDHLITLPEIKL